jgi:hypothetical protein
MGKSGKGKKGKSRGRDGDDESERAKHSFWTLPQLADRGLNIAASEIEGYGLYSIVPVPKDHDLCLVKRSRDMNPTNIACYINHAVVHPNCIITKKKDGSLWLTSDEPLNAEEELCVNYDIHASLAYIQTAEQLGLPINNSATSEAAEEYSRQHALMTLRKKQKDAK